MPTSSRLAGAVLLAALGAFAAYLASTHVPAGEPTGLLVPVSAVVGLFVGWLFTGRHLDRGKGKAVSVGLGSVALLTFWVFLLFSGQAMIERSTHLSYDGPVAALQDVFAIALTFAQKVMKLDVILTLVVGGAVVGAITGWVGRHYR